MPSGTLSLADCVRSSENRIREREDFAFVSQLSNCLALVGSYPPPFGGAATHVLRLTRLLSERQIPFCVYNAVSAAEALPEVRSVADRRWLWLPWFACCGQERSVYLLSDRLSAWVLIVLTAGIRRRKVGVRLRNSRLLDWMRTSRWRARLAGVALRRMDLVVCVNQELRQAVASLGADMTRVIVAPGFLPPEAGATDPRLLLPETAEFLDAHEPIVAANGKVNWYEGKDLYGLDMLVDLVVALKADYPRIGLVVAFWAHGSRDEPYLAELKERARAAGVAQHILFQTNSATFLPVLRKADVFVRPTCTDGDANSVREALFLGIPAVASDCIGRPSGTSIFPSRDCDGFVREVKKALVPPMGRNAEICSSPVDVDAYLDAISATLL